MSQAATSRSASARRPWPRWAIFTLWGVLGTLSAALVVFIATLWFGAVHGTEFSPQTFERRSYSFHELPLVGIQVTAIQHEDQSSVAETFLTNNKYVKAAPGGTQDWHIVIGSRGTKMFRKGDAAILMQYLDSQDANDYHRWVKWSEDHPNLAKVLWPSVQRLAEDELYVFIPDLFDLAKVIDEPVKLKQALNRTVAAKLLFLARRLQEREEHAEAIKLLDEAATLDPANKELAKARETSQAVLKNQPPQESKQK
jgi:hypothetical protein